MSRDWEQHFISTLCPECNQESEGPCSWRDRGMVCERIRDCAYGADEAMRLLSAERLDWHQMFKLFSDWYSKIPDLERGSTGPMDFAFYIQSRILGPAPAEKEPLDVCSSCGSKCVCSGNFHVCTKCGAIQLRKRTCPDCAPVEKEGE